MKSPNAFEAPGDTDIANRYSYMIRLFVSWRMIFYYDHEEIQEILVTFPQAEQWINGMHIDSLSSRKARFDLH